MCCKVTLGRLATYQMSLAAYQVSKLGRTAETIGIFAVWFSGYYFLFAKKQKPANLKRDRSWEQLPNDPPKAPSVGFWMMIDRHCLQMQFDFSK